MSEARLPDAKRCFYDVFWSPRRDYHQQCLCSLPVHPQRIREKIALNGITGDNDHPNPFTDQIASLHLSSSPVADTHPAVKSIREVFKTSLDGVWSTVGTKICELIKAWGIYCSSIDPARFFIHGPLGEGEKGSLGSVVIWIGVVPNSTSSDTAHNVSQEILKLLQDHGVEDAVVEWRHPAETGRSPADAPCRQH